MKQNSQRISYATKKEVARIAWDIITFLLITTESKDTKKNDFLRNTLKTNIFTEW